MSALSCSKCLVKFVSFADPTLILFMNIDSKLKPVVNGKEA